MWLWTAVIRLAQLCWKTTLWAEADVRWAALKGQLSLHVEQLLKLSACQSRDSTMLGWDGANHIANNGICFQPGQWADLTHSARVNRREHWGMQDLDQEQAFCPHPIVRSTPGRHSSQRINLFTSCLLVGKTSDGTLSRMTKYTFITLLLREKRGRWGEAV